MGLLGELPISAVDVGRSRMAAVQLKDIAPAVATRRRRKSRETLEGLAHDVQPAVAHFGAPSFKHMVDRLKVVLGLWIAIDRDAPLLAVPGEPNRDASVR